MNFRGPISQVEIEQRLLYFLDELESETEAFESLAEDNAKKEGWVEFKYLKQ